MNGHSSEGRYGCSRLSLEANQARCGRTDCLGKCDTFFHQSRALLALAKIIGKDWIIVAPPSVLCCYNPSAADIPDEDQSAVLSGDDEVGRIKLGIGLGEVTNVFL
jgi:hypothetical protein